jgi:hypothetical protein
MSDAKILQAAIGILEALPSLVVLDQQVTTLVTSTVSALQQMRREGRAPTDAEWAAQDAQIQSDLDVLHGRKVSG